MEAQLITQPTPPVPPAPQPFIREFIGVGYGGYNFAWVSADGRQVSYWLSCRDYIQDGLWAAINKTTWGYFGKGSPAPRIDSRITRLAVSCNQETAEHSLGLLHALEPDFGMRPTRLLYGGKSGTNSTYWVYDADRRWQFAPPLLSLFTLALRSGRTYDGSSWSQFFSKRPGVSGVDAGYITAGRSAIDFMVGKDYTKIFAKTRRQNYPAGCTYSDTHSYSGVVAMGSRTVSPNVAKYWADQQFTTE